MDKAARADRRDAVGTDGSVNTSHLLPAIGWAFAGAAVGWFARWGSVKLARLEGLEPGFKPWQVYGPPVLCGLLFGIFAWHLEIAHLTVLMERSVFIAVLVQMISFDLVHRLILDPVMYPS